MKQKIIDLERNGFWKKIEILDWMQTRCSSQLTDTFDWYMWLKNEGYYWENTILLRRFVLYCISWYCIKLWYWKKKISISIIKEQIGNFLGVKKCLHTKDLGATLLWEMRKDESEHHTIDWNLYFFKGVKLSLRSEIIFTMPSQEGYLKNLFSSI